MVESKVVSDLVSQRTRSWSMHNVLILRQQTATLWTTARDSNPGAVFSIPGFGIGEFLIPGSRRDYGIPAVWCQKRYYRPILLNFGYCHSVAGLYIGQPEISPHVTSRAHTWQPSERKAKEEMVGQHNRRLWSTTSASSWCWQSRPWQSPLENLDLQSRKWSCQSALIRQRCQGVKSTRPSMTG